MKIIIVFFLTGSLLIGCTSVNAPTTTEQLVLPTSTRIHRPETIPSSTPIQLPLNPQVSGDDYCEPPSAILEVGAGSDITEDEIVYRLVELWLKRYASLDAPPFCRIDGFKIDKVYNDPALYKAALEPKGDFMRIVVFSVKLIQIPTDWMSFAGKLDQDNWLHTGHIVAISKISEGYKLEFAYP